MKAKYRPRLCAALPHHSQHDRSIYACHNGDALTNIRYRVELSEAERTELEATLSGGGHPARKRSRQHDADAQSRRAGSVGMGLRDRPALAMRKARAALASRLAITMHGVLRHGSPFQAV
ncbi:hypothetical protein MAE02_58320 [Microvirga aerophila]|uniref:Uncharacterized protein n=1 Tax=Microvirga aerophila TaxID=670291 RepID=A0A512C1P2_9HYPH|nr:hypothetical protein MAE02_58320 [Microvirga aerophila]